MKQSIISIVSFLSIAAFAQDNSKFRQMYDELPTPNVYRTASGAPGHQYYQMRADYVIDLELDDENQRLYGSEEVTYFNNSPDVLTYFWVQLDQNMRAKDSDTKKIATTTIGESMSFDQLARLHNDFDGGFKIEYVKDKAGKDLPYTIVKTMMRIDLPMPLKPGASYTFKCKWWYNINDRMKIGGRAGYEYFPEDKNYLYTIAQFFPRMAVYNDVEGWQHKQFLGRGEFTLPFGNYKVKITVPADHMVASTGVLQNPTEVLSAEQRSRLSKAASSETPVMIVTPEEALQKEGERSDKKKSWIFHATNVRDFAFASSRKFIWDAMGVKFGNRTVMAMSYYPKEGNPLWEKYSTRVVAHTLQVYSKHTFDYPYPVAISVHTHQIGMEYPMICFNGGRPLPDGTYSEYTKYGMIGVIIHEVGHNYFPMIVNSDERQWTWMDEGLNTFLQYLTEQEWDKNYPSRRGPAANIVPYMSGPKDGMVPIMTNSESIKQFGNNSYAKPTAALNILRETVMGRELFDYAFKEYANRWMFKHPSPADFFRTMEDASGMDLDWFWRAWFFTTDHVDLAISDVKWYQIDTRNPEIEKALAKEREAKEPQFIGDIRNSQSEEPSVVERDPNMKDFYNHYDPFAVYPADKEDYERYLESLNEEEKAMLESGLNYYVIVIEMIGGIPMPVIIQLEFTDGSNELHYIPAEIWKMGDTKVSKLFYSPKELSSVALDPYLETADTDMDNNYWPPRSHPSKFKLYKEKQDRAPNKMQKYGDTVK